MNDFYEKQLNFKDGQMESKFQTIKQLISSTEMEDKKRKIKTKFSKIKTGISLSIYNRQALQKMNKHKIQRKLLRSVSQTIEYRIQGKLCLKFPLLNDLEQRMNQVHKKMQLKDRKNIQIPKQNLKKLTLYEKTKLKFIVN